MKNRSIEITVRADGELNIEALGFHGIDCDHATAFLEQALGQIDRKERKPEYYRRAQNQRVQKVGQ